jgi:hypothetical protein
MRVRQHPTHDDATPRHLPCRKVPERDDEEADRFCCASMSTCAIGAEGVDWECQLCIRVIAACAKLTGSSSFRVADHPDTPPTMRSRRRGRVQHRTRITITADGDDLSLDHVDMLGKGNEAEDCVDIKNRDAMLSIDNEPENVDALHDPGKLVQPLPKGCGAPIGVRGELTDRVGLKRKPRGIVVPDGIDIFLDDLNDLFARGCHGSADNGSVDGPSLNCRRYSVASKWPCEQAINPSSPIRQHSKPLMRTR